MSDMDALERAFEQVRKLSPEARERVRLVLDEMLAEADEAEFEREMQDPEYRAYVERELELSDQDVRAGRTITPSELRRRLDERFRNYG